MSPRDVDPVTRFVSFSGGVISVAGLGRDTVVSVIRVPISSLHVVDSPRLAGVNGEHVRALAELGADLPPILVHRATMRVIDGMHRVRAAQLRGDDSIAVRYFDGAEGDAFVLGVWENIAHGLPLTLADRRAAAARILLLYPQWSDRAIAAVAGLSPKTVGALRRRSSSDHGGMRSRVGRDGRVRPVNSGEVRKLASQYVAEHPDTSPREVARSTGVSLRTARDVRGRMNGGQVPTHAGSLSGRRRSGGRRVGVSPRVTLAASAEILRTLRSDPSLRFTESGRALIRVLDAQAGWARDAERVLDNLPTHCMSMVVSAARACADVWREFAEGVEARERDQRSASSGEPV